MFEDVTGRTIAVGDNIIFTQGAGQRVSNLNFGRVTRWSNKSLWVQELNPDLTVIMVPDGYNEPDGPPKVSYGNYTWQPTRFVKTGEKEIGETIINSPRADRFYIL